MYAIKRTNPTGEQLLPGRYAIKRLADKLCRDLNNRPPDAANTYEVVEVEPERSAA